MLNGECLKCTSHCSYKVIYASALLLEVQNDLDAVAPRVTLTLNQYCCNDYTVLITFGVRSDDDDVCEGKLNVTREIEPI